MRPENSKYICQLVISTLSILIAVAIFTIIVDPFSIFGIQINGFNAIKPAFDENALISKAFSVRRIKPNAIILGTSRSNQGYDPKYQGWANEKLERYNLATGGADIRRFWRYFQHAQHIQPLKQAFVGLDFLSFNTYRIRTEYEPYLAVNSQGKEQHWYQFPSSWFPYFLSYSSIGASIQTITQQFPSATDYLANGFKVTDSESFNSRKSFLETCERFVTGVYLPGPVHKYAFEDPETGVSTLIFYELLLREAYENKVALYLVINPVHAYLLEVIDNLGLWKTFETWKRELVNINEAIAATYNTSPFPVWDFSGYNSITTNPTVEKKREQKKPQLYHEASHFKREVGNLILDKVFNYQNPRNKVPNDFGVLLTSQNTEAHLSNIRANQHTYRQSHSQEVKEIEKLVIRALEGRRESEDASNSTFLEDI